MFQYYEREPDLHTAKALVRSWTQTPSSIDVLHKIFKILVDSNNAPDIFLLNSMIQACIKNNAHDTALNYIDTIIKYKLQPNQYTFRLLTSLCANTHNTAAAKKVLAALQNSVGKDDVNLIDCTQLIRGKCNVLFCSYKIAFSESADALAVLDIMDKRRLRIDPVAYITLLTVCTNSSDLASGKLVHKHLREKQVQLTLPLCNALIKFYGKCQDLPAAFSVFDNARQILKPNTVTYVCLLTSCAQSKNLERGKQVHQLIISELIEIPSDLYDALISMYIKCRDPVTALNLFQEMKQRGTLLTSVTYTSILSASPSLLFGKQIHTEITNTQVQMTSTLRNALINMYSKFNDVGSAFQLYTETKQQLVPDAVTYMCLLNGCANTGDLNRGHELHCTIVENQQLSLPVFNSLLSMYIKCGDPSSSLQLWNDRKLFCIQPDNISYSCVLPACTNLLQVRQMYNEIMGSNVELNSILCTGIINMFVKFGDFDSAFQLYDQTKHKFVPDSVTFVCLLTACSNKVDIQRGKTPIFCSLTCTRQATLSRIEPFQC